VKSLLVKLIANGEPFAAFGTTTAEHISTPAVFHAVHKTVLICTFAIMWLVSPFHSKTNIENFYGFGKVLIEKMHFFILKIKNKIWHGFCK